MISKMKELFEAQVSQSKIASILNISDATVSRRLKKLGLFRDNINKKISDIDIINLKDLSSIEIAKKLKISHQAIHERMIKLGINHKLNELTERSAEKIRKYQLDLKHFNPLDEVGCYWLGFIYADGCLRSKHKCRPSTFSIGLQKRDKTQLINFAIDIGLPTSQVKEQKRSFRIVINNIILGKLLCSLGMNPKYYYKKRVPNVPYYDHFVRGYLDGDGTIIIRKRKLVKFLVVRFAIKDYSFGAQFRNIIKHQTNIKLNGPYKMKSIWVLTTSDRKARRLAHWIWCNPIRCLSRKYDIYKRYFLLPDD